jgi:hypothetical protein
MPMPRRAVALTTCLALALPGINAVAAPAAAGTRVLAQAKTGNVAINRYSHGYTVLNHNAGITIPSGAVYYLNADVKIGAAANGDDMEVTPKIECLNNVKLISGVNTLAGAAGVETINTRGMVAGPTTCYLKTYVRPHNSNNTAGGTVHIYGSGPTFIENLGNDWAGKQQQAELSRVVNVNDVAYHRSGVYTVRSAATAVGAFFDAEVTSCGSAAGPKLPMHDANCEGVARIVPGQRSSLIGHKLTVVQYDADGALCAVLGTTARTSELVTRARHHEDQSGYLDSLPLNSNCTSRNVQAIYEASADANYNGFYINAGSPTGVTGSPTRVGVYSN